MAMDILPALKHFVSVTKLNPILVNFTVALVPVSVISDLMACFLKSRSLRETAWWTLVIATFITPLTAISGWLFWMPDDSGASGMAIHKWVGTVMAVLLPCLFLWRWRIMRQHHEVRASYFVLGFFFVAVLVYQGYLGGQQVFSG
jgi:uncharacterized membrane protein